MIQKEVSPNSVKSDLPFAAAPCHKDLVPPFLVAACDPDEGPHHVLTCTGVASDEGAAAGGDEESAVAAANICIAALRLFHFSTE